MEVSMAAQSGNKKKTTQKKSTTNKKPVHTSKSNYAKSKNITHANPELNHEITLILIFAISVVLFLSNFGLIGTIGTFISDFMFGLFGILAYIVPIFLFIAVAFSFSNQGNQIASIKLFATLGIFIMLGILSELISGISLALSDDQNVISEIYTFSRQGKCGGGILFGGLAFLLYKLIGIVGTYLILIVSTIICIVLITEKSLLKGVREGSVKVYESAKEDANTRKERKEEIAAIREQERILRMDKRVSGVMLNTSLETKETLEDIKMVGDMHEIRLNTDINWNTETVHLSSNQTEKIEEILNPNVATDHLISIPEPIFDGNRTKKQDNIKAEPSKVESLQKKEIAKDIVSPSTGFLSNKRYQFPSLSLLKTGEKNTKADPTKELKATALRLQQTLNTFGVKVTITDISQGPSVTRYELQPEQGVKVSKIVNLQDDIKLNLAATDIRIEAPIPGKAAIGIEVPNKENSSVYLRDLLESKEFKEFPSNIAFAVGKDISGQTIVADIGKMPHMLIAGATGSGKSVCINTLIMSILYKAHPDDVKLIMIDPKVVELSVYNGIPHLLIPVVTDPKKAAGALHWGVAEMTERYKQFADYNVRDLKGFNKMVESLPKSDDPLSPKKMPQIVIIVDELADLMMVAPGEVEESICRLAQLARAAGIHLIIATQRPSVDVITGLIKANMPSRVAFSVSSGVDSRTILDMNGAEKLLGKGDMLFYPQGYSKPARVQGAFVSDKEIVDVVDFLKNQGIGNIYNQEVQEKISHIGTGQLPGQQGTDGFTERDSYFIEAGRFFIEREKASIGMLQRVLKIGFNRAARIMDQLEEAGVVGAEEGTKPRKVLMSMEEFMNLCEEEI
jgi:DNA segregation ATPase FtsK/SpoIIIE, S-DNA-T family